jgi:molybdopterin/thiamine biosynthesis adenylyltransferase
VASQQVATLDLASLERFQSELIEAGFGPLPGDLREWVGPIAEPLREFTTATTMKVSFRDGWPFQYPRLFVDGIDELHMNAHGELCLWHAGAASDQWLTFAGYVARIEEWARRTRDGDFRSEDFALDAHLAFGRVRLGAIATLELDKLQLDVAPRGIRKVSGRWNNTNSVLAIDPGSDGPIEGRGYWVASVRTAPRDLDAAKSLLTPQQRNNFERRFRGVSEGGRPRLFLIAWQRKRGQEALVLLAKKLDDQVVAEAIEVAPTDTKVLKLRAGPDSELMSSKHVVVFGAGAIGSNVAFRLAEAGLGTLTVVDDGRLRPGDIVRHAVDRWAIGRDKVGAITGGLGMRTPWTRVRPVVESPWSPERISELIRDADCVVDATGFGSFANMLSVICKDERSPLISASLFRAGSVARVRRQAAADDVTITSRTEDRGYPQIPFAPEPPRYEAGCSAPVNNASPVAVAATAALTAAVVIDFLAGRAEYGDEVIEIFHALDEAPFDHVGTLRS